jgi:hypothetical protein
MRFGKVASWLLLAVVPPLAASVGCQGFAQRRNHTTPVAHPRRSADTKPVPPLRIDAMPDRQLPPTATSHLDSPPQPKTPTVPLPAQKLETAAATPSAPSDPLADVRRVYRLAADRYASVDGYVVQMRRRESVGGKDGAEELIELKFRKQPWSVHLKWIAGDGAGREVVYVQGRPDDKLHTKLAPTDPGVFLLKRISLSPDDPRVRGKSRHRITEAGVGVLLEHLGACLNAADQNDRRLGELSYVPSQKQPVFAAPLEGVEQTILAGNDPTLPKGGRRLCLFDPTTHLPAVISTRDDTGREVEFYCYERYQYPVSLTDADFDPDRLWAARR